MSFFVYYQNYSPSVIYIQLRVVSLNINYLDWIISGIKQKVMEYLLIISYGGLSFILTTASYGKKGYEELTCDLMS